VSSTSSIHPCSPRIPNRVARRPCERATTGADGDDVPWPRPH
jgi:hypothetical protein